MIWDGHELNNLVNLHFAAADEQVQAGLVIMLPFLSRFETSHNCCNIESASKP